ncbi:PKD domain-containing protein [bacterium]|nr:PKD domain-containing protein [bacterium]
MAGNCIAIIRLGSTITLCLALASCGGLRQDLGTAASDSNASLVPELSSQGGDGKAGWPVGLPVDQAQPWEELDSEGYVNRESSGINAQSDFTPGVERFDEAGDVSNLDQASRFASGTTGAGALSYALYRIPLGGAQPGVVSADVNLHLRDGGGSLSEYWLGLSSYGEEVWDWRGPFSDSHVRISLGDAIAGGADYTSELGNLFVAVLAYDGSSFDLVGLGINEYDAADTTAPPAPAALAVNPVAGGVLAEWIPVAAGDLAGYRIYYAGADFADGSEPFVRTVDYLEGATRHVLPGFAGFTHVRISAVDTSGNESSMSEIGKAIMLPGSAPVLELSTDIVSGKLGAAAMLTAMGASSYDWDIDGDGVYDITDDTTGEAAVNTSATGIIRPGVRGVSDGPGGPGTSIALGGVSLIITGKLPPHAHLRAKRTVGNAPFTVQFDASDSADLDGDIVQYEWDWESDGTYDENTGATPTASHAYDEAWEYMATVRVTDDDGADDTASVSIVARGYRLETPDSTGNVGWYTSLAVVNGNPAISYYDTTNDDLKYVRASDADGTSWGAPVAPDSTGGVGQYTSLAVVNGNPAISYLDGTNGDLRYVRASDADGTSWGAPLTPDSAGFVGRYTSLAVVDGYPAISYYDFTNDDLKYVRASDASGASWGAPVTPDSTGSVGSYTSLAVVNGNAAVSYYDGTNTALKYVLIIE